MPKGVFIRTKEHCLNISKALKGRVFSKSHLLKLRKWAKTKKAKPRTGKYLICPKCGKYFYVQVSGFNIRKYCSISCMSKGYLKGGDLICKVCGKEYHRAPSQIFFRGSSVCSNKCKLVYMSRTQIGKKSHLYIDGRSKKNRRLRASGKWRVWREKVFRRDNYTCQNCGLRSGDGKTTILHPHHIKPFALFPKQRFVISNGLTLCITCHKEVHNGENPK